MPIERIRWRPDVRPLDRAMLGRAIMPFVIAAMPLGICEVGTRTFLTSPSRQVYDPEIGFRYIPRSVIFYGGEGGARLQLNSLGFNDDEVGPKGSRPRVVVLGDSMTEAFQVERPLNYVSCLKELRPELEFVNLGRAHAGPLEYWSILHRFDKRLDPDLVVFAFSIGDLDEIRRSNLRIERDSRGKIKALLLQADALRAEAKHAIQPIVQQSALATLLMRRFGQLLQSWTWPSGPATMSRDGLTDTECTEILTFILREATSRQLVVAVFLPQLDYLAERRSRITEASAREASIVARAAELADVPFFLPVQDLVRQYRASGQPGHGFANNRMGTGHLNPAGHMAVAQGLASFLRLVVSAVVK